MADNLYKNINFWDPKIYIERAQPQLQAALAILKRYTFKGNENILDIGCGPGNITAMIAKKVPKGNVHGIDYSKNMIDFANLAYEAEPNLSFELQDVNHLSLNKKYDLITSFNTFQWIVDPLDVLPKILSCLTNSGCLLVSLMRPSSPKELANIAVVDIMNEPQWKPYFADFAPPDFLFDVNIEDYKEVLVYVGFKLEFFEETCFEYPFSSKVALAQWFESWMAHRHAIPEDKRNAFFMEIVSRYLQSTGQSDNKITLRYMTWNFMAKK